MRFSMTTRGFTLIELIISLGVLVIILGISGVSLSRAYQNFSLRAADRELVGALASAHRRAQSGVENSSWGVFLPYDPVSRTMSSLTIFAGSSFAARTVALDEVHPFSEVVTLPVVDFSGAGAFTGNDQEIVFSPLSGRTAGYGYVELEFSDTTTTIFISPEGMSTR